MRISTFPIALCLAACLSILLSCNILESEDPPQPFSEVNFFFESGFYDTNRGAFVKEKSIGIADSSRWSIRIDSSSGFESSRSLRYFLNLEEDVDNGLSEGLGDGRVWIEINFGVDLPRSEHEVDVSFVLKPLDRYPLDTTITGVSVGDRWSVIAGASPDSVESADDLVYHKMPTWSEEDGTWAWEERSYSFRAESNGLGNIHIFVGISGETLRTGAYLMDDLRIRATQLQ